MKNIVYLLIILGMITSCSIESETETDSDNFRNKKERIERLKMEIKSYSDYKDAEFELFNVNGFHNQRSWSAPGASSWDYKFAVKIDTIDIAKWTRGMKEVEFANYDNTWTKEIVKLRKQNWKTYSKPKYFIRDESVTMLVFVNEGIIFKRVIGE